MRSPAARGLEWHQYIVERGGALLIPGLLGATDRIGKPLIKGRRFRFRRDSLLAERRFFPAPISPARHDQVSAVTAV